MSRQKLLRAQYIDGWYREHGIVRIRDARLDPELNVQEFIYVFTAREDDLAKVQRVAQLKRLDSWILDEELEWLRKDRRYWKTIYQRAESETFTPGTGVHRTRGDGQLDPYNTTRYVYWKQLCAVLPAGDPQGFPGFAVPESPVWWLRTLRYWIRRENQVRTAGTRRTLEDYPPEVQAGLQVAIRLMTKPLECVDNIRFAETSKPGEMRRFRRAERQGCCGSINRYVIVGTKQYIIGCNYGH